MHPIEQQMQERNLKTAWQLAGGWSRDHQDRLADLPTSRRGGAIMTSHCDRIRHPHPLCSNCRHREAMVSLNARRSPKSRKAKRAGRYTLKAHDLCGRCWRAMCAQFWVHGEVSE